MAMEDGWNTPEVLELVSRARSARRMLAASADLQTYQARTEGHVYFFIDPEQGERYLIRIDQIASEVWWMAPNLLQQRVVGERSETRLPVQDFDYYLDRLTLVPHGFEDEIRIGSGLDVEGVPHPLAPPPAGAGEELYDYRLGQSVAVFVGGRTEPVRIQEIAVRPKDPSRPAIIGGFHVDLASASLTRMAFTFTPASYVDPRNDRITVELDYGLWDGRYWLPNVQRIEVRREIPQLDLGVGTVIRAMLQVRDYVLDAPLPPRFGVLPRVSFAPAQERRAYPFSTGLYDNMAADGLAAMVVDPDVRELRERATELITARPGSGLSPVRFHYPGFSSAIRYRRAEGLRLGVGGSTQPQPTLRVRGGVGYALAESGLQADLTLERLVTAQWSLNVRARAGDLDDLGLVPGSSALISSIGALVRAEDYVDPYHVGGGSVGLEYRTETGSLLSVAMGVERHRSATLELDSSPLRPSRRFRPIRPVEKAEFLRVDAALRRPVSLAGAAMGVGEVAAMVLHGQPGYGVGLSSELDQRWGPATPTRELQLRANGWVWLGDPLPQGHRLLGGRGTVPGFAYREWAGRRALATSLVGSTDIWGPMLRLRAGLHSGWAGGVNSEVASRWAAGATKGIRTAASIGIGVAWDLVQLDLARGINGGEWQLLLSVDRRWWDRL